MHIEIPAQVERILAQLRNNGYEAYAVGGCVRDTLLLRKPEDWDITTIAKPDQVKAVFGRTIDTGLQHGTVTVLRDGVGYEITTYRIDGEYEDGRHPKEVAFTSELEEDLRRRDFTINAMAYSHETGIVDIFGGMKDLREQVIRCVGNAMERFTEDALRILRAIRFSAQLGFGIEKSTYEALSVIAPNLRLISRERIQTELLKTLLSDHPEKIMLVKETGMAPYISDAFEKSISFIEQTHGIDCPKKLKRLTALKQEKALRLAAFLYPCKEELLVKLLKELKLDNDTTGKVRVLTDWMKKRIGEDLFSVRQAMSSMSDGLFDMLLELRKVMLPEEEAHIAALEALCKTVRKEGHCIRLGDLAVGGTDLLNAGMKPGKELGETLNHLFSLVLKHPDYNRKDYLLSMVFHPGEPREASESGEGKRHG